jgi:hypothetical protein
MAFATLILQAPAKVEPIAPIVVIAKRLSLTRTTILGRIVCRRASATTYGAMKLVTPTASILPAAP